MHHFLRGQVHFFQQSNNSCISIITLVISILSTVCVQLVNMAPQWSYLLYQPVYKTEMLTTANVNVEYSWVWWPLIWTRVSSHKATDETLGRHNVHNSSEDLVLILTISSLGLLIVALWHSHVKHDSLPVTFRPIATEGAQYDMSGWMLASFMVLNPGLKDVCVQQRTHPANWQ